MAKITTAYADRDVQYPNRYTLTNVSGTTYDVVRAEGTVNVAGTLLNTTILNEIKTSVNALYDEKAPLANPTFTGTVVLPSTTSIGNVSSTEIGYVDGVTSAIQTQLNSITSRLDTIEGSLYKIGIACPSNNADNALSDGCYNYDDTTTNRPTGTNYGTIFVMVSSGLTGNNTNNWVNQIGMSTGDTMHFRQKVNAGAWTAWKTISKS